MMEEGKKKIHGAYPAMFTPNIILIIVFNYYKLMEKQKILHLF